MPFARQLCALYQLPFKCFLQARLTLMESATDLSFQKTFLDFEICHRYDLSHLVVDIMLYNSWSNRSRNVKSTSRFALSDLKFSHLITP